MTDVRFTITGDRDDRWRKAAEADEMSLADWIRMTCDNATNTTAITVVLRNFGGKEFKGPDPKPGQKAL